jgi:predicted signal transduction protein with EAL and GGDEF domain
LDATEAFFFAGPGGNAMPQLMQEKERQKKVKDIIREDRLIVHFQPIVSISRKTVVVWKDCDPLRREDGS